MADNLRLRVVLDMAERVVAPMKRIGGASSDAARALKAAKDRLKELNAQQAQVGEFRTLKTNLQETAAKLTEAQAKVGNLARAFGQAGPPTRAMERDMARAKREAAALTAQHTQQQEKLQQLRTRLSAAGISTRELGAQSQRLRGDIAATNAAITEQTAKLRANAEQQKQLAKLRDQHAKSMVHTGMAAAGSAALMAGGNKLAGPLRSVVGAFVPAENSETQLRASMMTNTGAVGPEYKQILDLATRLGDRLPGTTADFIDMMTMLRRQGMTSQAILGGLGESAAYLGIQLRMPVTAAAEFAAKMQDATQTAERDMMGLMDTIQRAYYLGVDPTNMLQGFKNMGAVMPYLGKKGLEASQQLAPLLVMMDQAGMAGEASGNAIRKVVQLSLDSEKLAKTNRMLAGEGVELNFATKGGKFAGLDNLFAQLDKLKGIDSDVKRIAAMKKLFGDDSETHQVLNTMMEKGIDGYREVVAKMQAQADLRKRVDEQLKTVSAAAEAAQGSFTNMLKDMGATIAPDLVLILNKLGELANGIGAWTRENQAVVKWGLRLVGVVSVLAVGVGALGLSIASVLGPLMITRFLMARLALSMGAARAAAAAAGPALGVLGRMAAWVGRVFSFVPVVLGFVGRALLVLGRVLMLTPWGRALGLLATAAVMIYRNWDGIKGGLIAIWEQLSGATAAWWARTTAGAAALWQTLVSLKDRFFTAGGDLMDGLINGITSRVQMVRDAIGGVADDVGAWFREKLGIASPSKVFMQYGGWISEGAALGIAGGQGAVRTAALAVAAAAAMPMQAAALVPPDTAVMQAAAAALPALRVPDTASPPMASRAATAVQVAAIGLAQAGTTPAAGAGAQGAALRMDTRPPLAMPAAQAAQPAAGGGTYHITINAAPGMDEKALARAVAAELDRRERAQRSRVLSAMSDID